ncbi:redox-sensing transcriptional repressor Rex [Paenibacillus chitinolyticus]|uniref:Redox-sensing transcriptional repressor Rex n=1 Tax=Paenibacillus chitinolyticus TaxID=79263 RepID=A0A410WVK4_9BACL|nr:redox-sensing transcriptional repressor Rex [Paenibacillus chitinolyticus]MCY9589327.1 redox-sensing transcriptional repressor Rex [Paenibacillus chitinolyticus]MCY9594400.1 redox-sensing transcriptional repressor Rex [Paenibacillus chitinolyticus]QAV18350.1 redox-sensing transcriptional repressor Rex [Paenibacillus chitinolyticus]
MKSLKISEAVVKRLPIYLRFLNELSKKNVLTVSSQDLGQKLNLNPAQIRKDLAYFGEFGKKGIGYDVTYLIEKIRQILKLDRQIPVALVGSGNLGRALCNYNIYLRDQMKITAIFDSSPDKIGQVINNMSVLPMEHLADVIRDSSIRIGIITVPAPEAQNVANQFVKAGIEAILNFAPSILKVPEEIRVHHADFTAELQSLAYYLPE